MRLASLSLFSIVFVALTAFSAPRAAAAEMLSEILRESKWDHIIGTWVDADTGGDNLQLAFAWKLEERVIEVTSKYEDRRTVALMGVHGKTGEVYHAGADSAGSSVLGKWSIDEDNGDALLDFEYVSGEGEEGEMRIRYHRIDKDTVKMTIELPDPIEVELIRKK